MIVDVPSYSSNSSVCKKCRNLLLRRVHPEQGISDKNVAVEQIILSERTKAEQCIQPQENKQSAHLNSFLSLTCMKVQSGTSFAIQQQMTRLSPCGPDRTSGPQGGIALVPDLRANEFARNDDFNAPVFLTSGGSIVIRNRHCLPESCRCYIVSRQPLRDQEFANGIPALLRESFVIFVASSAVRVTFHL